jgi:phosphatidate phosphatase APP1
MMYGYGNNKQKKLHSRSSNRFTNKVLPHDKNKCLSNQFFNEQVIRNVLQGKTCHTKMQKSGYFFDKLLYFDPKKIFHNTSVTKITNAY